MKPLYLLTLVLLTITVTCSSCKKAVRPDASQVDDIREAVFRHQFGNNASAFQENRKVYFLEINGQDPSDPFMQRFAGHNPVVKKASEASTSAGETTGVVDKVTGQHGLIFNQGAIQWIEDDVVEVSGGYFEAGLSASGNIYSVTKKNNKWGVTENKMDWIS